MIGLVDDHNLIVQSLSTLLNSFEEFEVVLTALNGKDLQEKIIKAKKLPEIMLIDVHMPIMDGIDTASWLNQKYPTIKLVALTMSDDDNTIINMMKAGCIAYLLKDTSPEELQKALKEIKEKGYHNSELVNSNLRRLLFADKETDRLILNNNETKFLKLICSDLTYKEVGGIMKLSDRNIEACRINLFQKFNVLSRVGLVVEAIKKGYVSINDL